MKLVIGLAVIGLGALSSSALAGPASDAVKKFYTPSVEFEAEPALRGRFVDPAKAMLDLYDKTLQPEEVGCIDFVLAIDAQDYDQGELDRTLKLKETVSGDNATVVADFNLFPDDAESVRQIEWTLKQVDGAWKVADIASKASDWRLSTFDCK